MANACRVSPVVFKQEGKKVVEYDSKLYHDIYAAVKDREESWRLWAYTKTTDFKNNYGKKVDYDELGEVKFLSLIKAIGLEDVYNKEKSISEAMRDYGFANASFDSSREAVSRINEFNSKEPKFIAISQKNDDGYHIEVRNRTSGNIEGAREQSYNNALTGELIGLLQSIGFDVSWVSDPQYNGLFDPENATINNGLITVIKIAKGELGEQALPEEFSHLIIEGLQNHPLVKRLLASITDEQIHEILGDQYDDYITQYNGDMDKMIKEVAGKMLGQYITGQGTISRPVMQPKKNLLSRIWNWAKNLFAKITGKQLADANSRAYDTVDSIYNLIASGNALPIIDRHAVLDGTKLYQLQKDVNELEKVSRTGEDILARVRRMEIGSGKNTKATTETLESIKNDNDSDNYYSALTTFLDDTVTRIGNINQDIKDVKNMSNSDDYSTMQVAGAAAKVINKINTFAQGYDYILDVIATFDNEENYEQLQISKESGERLAGLALESIKLMTDLKGWANGVRENILLNSCRTVYGEDKVRGIGSKRNEVMKLETVLHHAARDINYIDRWVSAMSDADDPLLTFMDGIVKNQQYERDMVMIDVRAEIAQLDKKLRDAGYSTDFMTETGDNGVPTGRIISEYDWNSYFEDKKDYIKHLRSLQEEEEWTDQKYNERLRQWLRGTKNGYPRLIRVYVDPNADKAYKEGGIDAVEEEFPNAIYEEMPNPKVYTKYADRINNLSVAEREYYDNVMRIKREMMTKIPHRGQGIYRHIYISKGLAEGILDNSTDNPLQATKDYFHRQFVRRPDDIGFGVSQDFPETVEGIISRNNDSEKATEEILKVLSEELDPDIINVINPNKVKNAIKNASDSKEAASSVVEVISDSDFCLVDTDFANNRIQRLPVYYTRRLNDMRMLSTDFSASLVAYSAMAVNYEKMNEVVDILEVARDYINKRDVMETNGNKPLMSQFTALGKKYKHFVMKAGQGSNIAGRMNDFMSSVVYEERKESAGTIPVLNLDASKTIDTIKNYTGILGLGFNLLSAVSNVTVGKLQQWLEAGAGEYFTLKDYAKAIGQYTELMPGCLAEINSPVKKNKLSLLIQLFDPMGDYYESLRDPSFNKSGVARILGNGVLAYIGMNAGEHLLHCQTMLAMLNNIKLNDGTTGKKISLYDALEVKEENGITKLALKEGLSYTRDLIDQKGTPESNKNYGRPLKDKDGKIKTEAVPLKDLNDNVTRRYIIKKKRIMRKVNDSLNGAFNVNDKGPIHRKAYGRLIMQYRQWMPAHYERRFARAHYDNDLEQWREGFYITFGKYYGRIITNLYDDLKKGEIRYAKTKDKLNAHEKANLRRAWTEISLFVSLMSLVRLGGRVKDRDRSWLDRMVLYQINRMYLETGASMPFNTGFFSNIFQLLQSPAASIDSFEKVGKVIQFWNIFDEVQRGRYKGWSEWGRDVFKLIPGLDQIQKAYYLDDSMFTMFDN